MKAMRLSLVIVATALMTIGMGGLAHALHDGGVADCAACHSMHNPAGSSNPFLLIEATQSATCLSCHQNAGDTGPSSYHISTAPADMTADGSPLQRSPGGDFAWLKVSYTWEGHDGTETEAGETHGHNIVAPTFGYNPATTATTEISTLSASQLGCHSCHDPHGQGRRLSDGSFATTGAPIIRSSSRPDRALNAPPGQAVGLYRILAYPGYERASGATWRAWPLAVAPRTYNTDESATTQVRVAYAHQTGTENSWGNWCRSCHPNMYNTSTGSHTHPVDRNLGATLATNYTNYVSSGVMNSSNPWPYLSLVPFSEQFTDWTTLANHAVSNNTYPNGPASTDQVMCLSCHRAHASGFKHALRWNNEETFIREAADTYAEEMGRTDANFQAAYNSRPATVFGLYQRSLCNKCHVKD